MRYWWVNQNQTYKSEVPGGFLWSPKTRADGARNQFYGYMREVAVGDVIFSFCDTLKSKRLGSLSGGQKLRLSRTSVGREAIGHKTDGLFRSNSKNSARRYAQRITSQQSVPISPQSTPLCKRQAMASNRSISLKCRGRWQRSWQD